MMRRVQHFIILIYVFIFIAACNQGNEKKTDASSAQNEAGSYGEKLMTADTLTGEGLISKLALNDTVLATVRSTIVDNCQHTGCWMDLDVGNGKTINVTFKDDSFTIPLDSKGKTATAQGIATKELVSVEMLKNYARDDGKSQEEIDAITEPEYTYKFVASGVVIK